MLNTIPPHYFAIFHKNQGSPLCTVLRVALTDLSWQSQIGVAPAAPAHPEQYPCFKGAAPAKRVTLRSGDRYHEEFYLYIKLPPGVMITTEKIIFEQNEYALLEVGPKTACDGGFLVKCLIGR